MNDNHSHILHENSLMVNFVCSQDKEFYTCEVTNNIINARAYAYLSVECKIFEMNN